MFDKLIGMLKALELICLCHLLIILSVVSLQWIVLISALVDRHRAADLLSNSQLRASVHGEGLFIREDNINRWLRDRRTPTLISALLAHREYVFYRIMERQLRGADTLVIFIWLDHKK